MKSSRNSSFVYSILLVSALAISLLFYSKKANADILSPGSHYVEKCAKIVNLDKFPDVVLIGYYTGPMSAEYTAYKVENNQCLTKGYKLNAFSLYWVSKSIYSKLNLKNLAMTSQKVSVSEDSDTKNTPADLISIPISTEIFSGSVDDFNPIIKETDEYSIADVTNDKLSLYLSKKVSDYNDGSPEKVETFANTLSSPTPAASISPNVSHPTPPTKTTSPSVSPTTNTKIPTDTQNQPDSVILNNANPTQAPVKRSFWQNFSCFFVNIFGGSCK